MSDQVPLFGRSAPRLRKAPIEMLQRPLRAGNLVRIKVGKRAGQVFAIDARLTSSDEPAFLTGAARYAVSVEDGRVADYTRAELASVTSSKQRARRAAGAST